MDFLLKNKIIWYLCILNKKVKKWLKMDFSKKILFSYVDPFWTKMLKNGQKMDFLLKISLSEVYSFWTKSKKMAKNEFFVKK